jgi:hypothetical protein
MRAWRRTAPCRSRPRPQRSCRERTRRPHRIVMHEGGYPLPRSRKPAYLRPGTVLSSRVRGKQQPLPRRRGERGPTTSLAHFSYASAPSWFCLPTCSGTRSEKPEDKIRFVSRPVYPFARRCERAQPQVTDATNDRPTPALMEQIPDLHPGTTPPIRRDRRIAMQERGCPLETV